MRYKFGDRVIVITPIHGQHFFGSEGVITGYRKGEYADTYAVEVDHPTFGGKKVLSLSPEEMRPISFRGESGYLALVDNATKKRLVQDIEDQLLDQIEEEFPHINPDISYNLASGLAEDIVGSKLYNASIWDEDE